jgi:DHA1 family inner membrane transport protein
VMLFVFGLAGVAGSILGGYGADRWGYRATALPMLVVLGLSLLSFSLVPAIAAGSLLTLAGVGTAMFAWGAVVFAIIPLQQHHLIWVAPDEPGGVLSLNSSAVYVGQGLGAGLGSLILGYAPLAALGYAGALLAIVALVMLVLGARLSVSPAGHAPSSNPLRKPLPRRSPLMRRDRIPDEAASASLAATEKGLC